MPEPTHAAARMPSATSAMIAALTAIALVVSGQFASTPAEAHPASAQSASIADGTATVSGQLRRHEAPGHPIRIGGYSVELTGYTSATPNTYRTWADAEGRFSLSGIQPGSYLISIHAPGDRFYMAGADGTYNGSRSFTPAFETFIAAGDVIDGDFFVPFSLYPGTFERERLAGSDRYETAAAVSQYAFLERTPIAFLASGQDFPDALSAAPAAAHLDAPLLLTARGAIPQPILAELQRLGTEKVVIVGGAGVIGANVVTQLHNMGIEVERIAGADRYQTSIEVAQYAFAGCDQLSVATGANFPDALALSTLSGPLLLASGTAPALGAETLAAVKGFGCSSVRIAGGPAVVSTGIESQLRSMVPNGVVRYAGVDRYDTARRIADTGAVQRPHAFIASGSNFPDALTLAAYAGRVWGPLYLARQECVPAEAVRQIRIASPAVVTVVGGYGVIGHGIEHLDAC